MLYQLNYTPSRLLFQSYFFCSLRVTAEQEENIKMCCILPARQTSHTSYIFYYSGAIKTMNLIDLLASQMTPIDIRVFSWYCVFYVSSQGCLDGQ